MIEQEIDEIIDKLVATRQVYEVGNILEKIPVEYQTTIVAAALYRSKRDGYRDALKDERQRIASLLNLGELQ